MKKFSDFSKEEIFDGDKISLNDVINKEILILGYKISESKFKDREYMTLHISLDGEKHVIFTGSGVLMDQLNKYKEELPFVTIIRKINKYCSLT